ncbi:AAA family ATPase [Pseudonocardia sp.]|uniref:AAA family ATPase n=1 Tax=Pseudonocardia sp. TaxID=60912 RepID=UPI003D13069F
MSRLTVGSTAEGPDRAAEPLFGRQHEQAKLRAMLDGSRGGRSGVLVLVGEAGIGKTRLLDSVVTRAADVAVMRLVGIESEMHLGFAALHQLLTGLLADIRALPAPQSRALTAAFGLTDDGPPDLYLVGLAALTLLTGAAASGEPLVIVVDDAQWLDAESATVLGFVARRLHADRVCLWVALRDETQAQPGFDGLPVLRLDPLSEAESGELLDSTVGGRIAPSVRERLLQEAAGNPLAIAEFARGLTTEQREGLAPQADPFTVDRRVEAHFGLQVAALPAPTRTLLVVLAAEPTGDADLVWRAGIRLGFDDGAATAAQDAGLLVFGPGPLFRHPLIRSAVYQGASALERLQRMPRWPMPATPSVTATSGPGTGPRQRGSPTKTSRRNSRALPSARPGGVARPRRRLCSGAPPR